MAAARAHRLAAHLRREAAELAHSAGRPFHRGVDLRPAVDRLLARAEAVSR